MAAEHTCLLLVFSLCLPFPLPQITDTFQISSCTSLTNGLGGSIACRGKSKSIRITRHQAFCQRQLTLFPPLEIPHPIHPCSMSATLLNPSPASFCPPLRRQAPLVSACFAYILLSGFTPNFSQTSLQFHSEHSTSLPRFHILIITFLLFLLSPQQHSGYKNWILH